jgi:hypothetical protein
LTSAPSLELAARRGNPGVEIGGRPRGRKIGTDPGVLIPFRSDDRLELAAARAPLLALGPNRSVVALNGGPRRSLGRGVDGAARLASSRSSSARRSWYVLVAAACSPIFSASWIAASPNEEASE